MKKIAKNIVVFFILITMISCSKDKEVKEDIQEEIQQFEVTGTIKDENNVPISGAEIIFENKSTITSFTGGFNISVNKNTLDRKHIIIKATNKFEAYRAFSTKGIDEINLEIRMLNKGTIINFNSSNGANITNSGGSISILPNSIQKENGEIYNGQVKASVRMINTDVANFEQLMQGGDFAGENASNQNGNLKSYGFYTAELEDPTGNKLNLKNGTTASFSLPLAPSYINTAPQTVKLWHFDKIKAIWVENGTATKIGGKYVGNVPHFSEWNCDDWYSTSTVSGPWIQVPSSFCNGSFDVAFFNTTTSESFIIYNMPTAASGTFYFKNGSLALQTCQLYALYNNTNQSNIYFSVPSEVSGKIIKTGLKSFTFSCTLTNDFSNPENPSSVIGFNGSGSY